MQMSPSHLPTWDHCTHPQLLKEAQILIMEMCVRTHANIFLCLPISQQLPMFSKLMESATLLFVSSTRIALSNATCFTILLHSVYLILASASFGFALVTCNKHAQLIQKVCFNAQQWCPLQYTIQSLLQREGENSDSVRSVGLLTEILTGYLQNRKHSINNNIAKSN